LTANRKCLVITIGEQNRIWTEAAVSIQDLREFHFFKKPYWSTNSIFTYSNHLK